jgi:hypothetical protein
MLFKNQVLYDVMLCPLLFPDISQERSALIFGFQQSKKVGHYPMTQIHILGDIIITAIHPETVNLLP